MSDHGRCGDGSNGVPGVGCGEPFVWEGEKYRCVDCGVYLHAKCAKEHWKRSGADVDSLRSSLAAKEAEIVRLTAEIERLTRAGARWESRWEDLAKRRIMAEEERDAARASVKALVAEEDALTKDLDEARASLARVTQERDQLRLFGGEQAAEVTRLRSQLEGERATSYEDAARYVESHNLVPHDRLAAELRRAAKLSRALKRSPSPALTTTNGPVNEAPHAVHVAAPIPKEDAPRTFSAYEPDHLTPRSPASDAAPCAMCTTGHCGIHAAAPAATGGTCPECGAMLNADDLEMARRRYAFRPGQVNNLGGWASPITVECGSCGTGRSPSPMENTGGAK